MTVDSRIDEDIQRDVLKELKWDSRVQPNEIGVAVKDGIVTLTGWVDSYLKKVAAEEAAHRVPTVKAVVNDIEVRLPGSSERTDVDVAEAVLSVLARNVGIETDNIDITVDHGWVTLKGEVDFGFQKREAERAVASIVGVRGITNLLTVRERPTPANLKERIEQALERNAEIDARHITVEVQGSKVILRGTVRFFAEKEAAEKTVWASPGVTAVENQIVVSPPI